MILCESRRKGGELMEIKFGSDKCGQIWKILRQSMPRVKNKKKLEREKERERAVQAVVLPSPPFYLYPTPF